MVVVKSMLSIKGKGEKRMSAKLFWKQFWVLFTFSLLGVFMIIPTIEITLSQVLKDIPNKPDLPLAVLAGLSLINPIILLTSLRKKSPTSKREGAPAPVKVGDEFRLALAN
ncbi:hypothetical protein, partial [Geobacillus stearothermophilus]|uniref:hypothetical protein n=1 Tax=Geobacillus stearothermophilus TaxID=1422 RepID=UPI003D254CF6